MQNKWIRTVSFMSTVLALSACANEGDDLGPVDDAEALAEDEEVEATTHLTGQLLDTDEQPVAGAEVVLAIGSVPVTEAVTTNDDGFYTLAVPTERVHEAWAARQEVTLLFTSPTEDREPYGTAEGDLVHLLPATLRQFVPEAELVAGRRLAVRTAHVPRQGQGFAITDELVESGGELTWITDDSQYGKGFSVTLVVEPGSIHKGEDPQGEITLTLLEQVKAPMAIPEDGFGPLWTIQPRDIVFDPPARIRVEGERFPMLGASELEPGQRTELYGASLETGWKLFGDIEMVKDEAGRVVLETPEGIISHGAWGHIYSASGNDYGMLVECYSKSAKESTGADVRVKCAVLNDNAYWYQDPNDFYNWNITNLCQSSNFVPPVNYGGGYDDGFLTCDQWDFGTANHNGNAMVYASDAETRCRTCGSAPAFQVALTAGESLAGSTEPVWGAVTAFPLCPAEETITDMNVLWNSLYQRLGLDWADGAALPWEDAGLAGEVEATLAWRNFSTYAKVYVPDPVGCQ